MYNPLICKIINRLINNETIVSGSCITVLGKLSAEIKATDEGGRDARV